VFRIFTGVASHDNTASRTGAFQDLILIFGYQTSTISKIFAALFDYISRKNRAVLNTLDFGSERPNNCINKKVRSQALKETYVVYTFSSLRPILSIPTWITTDLLTFSCFQPHVPQLLRDVQETQRTKHHFCHCFRKEHLT